MRYCIEKRLSVPRPVVSCQVSGGALEDSEEASSRHVLRVLVFTLCSCRCVRWLRVERLDVYTVVYRSCWSARNARMRVSSSFFTSSGTIAITSQHNRIRVQYTNKINWRVRVQYEVDHHYCTEFQKHSHKREYGVRTARKRCDFEHEVIDGDVLEAFLANDLFAMSFQLLTPPAIGKPCPKKILEPWENQGKYSTVSKLI